MEFSPLRVTAKLAGAVASYDGRIQLDSLLEHVAWRRAGRPAFELGDKAASFEIPVAKIEHAGVWIWSCSESQAHWVADDIGHYNRQFPTERARYLREDQRKVNISAGPCKSFRLPLPLLITDKVTWYALGDRDLISDMLSDITHLGKKHNAGRGKVSAWSIDAVGEDHSLMTAEKRPARPIPCIIANMIGVNTNGLFPQRAGHRPPYWHSERMIDCYLPEPPSIGVEEWQ